MYVEVKSKKAEIYSMSMQVHAHFTGLRYLMFHWPILSAVVGVAANLFLILFILLLSWYHLCNIENSESAVYNYTQAFKESIYPKKTEEKSGKKVQSGKYSNFYKI